MTASKLVRPSAEYKDSYLEALEEYHEEGRYLFNKTSKLRENFEDFIKAMRAERGHPHQPYEEWASPVPETVTWLVKDDKYLGTVNIRHRLNWHLEKWGGHIHFVIRPSMRGKGFGKKILLKSIPIANYLGIDRALLTVSPDNKAAIRTIESCGGTLDDHLPATEKFPEQLRYWLDCT